MKIIRFFFYIVAILLLPEISYAENIPEWVLSPDLPEYSYCAAGFAPKNDLSVQKKIARVNAMSELSKAIEISISNEIEINSKVERSDDKDTNVTKDVASSSRQRSNSIINNAVEVDNFLDSDTGILYLRMCIK